MTKTAFITKLAAHLGSTTQTADNTWSAVKNAIESSLREDLALKLTGFGVFKVKDRPARTARNPKTGETVQVAPSRRVSFRYTGSL